MSKNNAVPLLTIEAITQEFVKAKQVVERICVSHDISYAHDCVLADKFVDNQFTPVVMYAVNGVTTMAYSVHYRKNRVRKLLKTFVRYILTSNADGTFKTYEQLMRIYNQLPINEHYEVAFQNDYLVPDVPIKNALICNKCKRMFAYDEHNAVLNDHRHYMCQCGGSVSVLRNGVKTPFNTPDRYATCNVRALEKLYTKDSALKAQRLKQEQKNR